MYLQRLLGLYIIVMTVACSTGGNVIEKDKSFRFTNYQQKAVEKYGFAEFTDDAQKINSLGIMYLYGFGVDKNPHKADHLFQKAANLGYGSGYCNLAIKHIEEGITGYKKAHAYYQLAQKSPRRSSCGYRNIAKMYINGDGVKPDLDLAKKLLLISISLEDGQQSGEDEYEISQIEFSRNKKSEADEWYLKSKEKGYNPNLSNQESLIKYLDLN